MLHCKITYRDASKYAVPTSRWLFLAIYFSNAGSGRAVATLEVMNMNTVNTNEMTQQFDNMFMAPARAFMTLSAEKMINAQMDASKAYTDTSIAQMRQMMNVKDAEGLRSYMESQQNVAKELAERAKGDANKVVSLQQDFIQKSQKLTEENVKQAQTAVSKMSKTA